MKSLGMRQRSTDRVIKFCSISPLTKPFISAFNFDLSNSDDCQKAVYRQTKYNKQENYRLEIVLSVLENELTLLMPY